jgi:uncharacterized protein DUF4350
MITARNVTVVIVAAMVVGMIASVVSALLPPSARTYAPHSFSGRGIGYRGVYELLASLDVPVRRHEGAPTELFAGDARVVLLEPDMWGLEVERAYLKQMEAWVTEGGEVVIVTPRLGASEMERMLRTGRVLEEDEDDPLYHAFGKEQLRERLGIGALKIEPEYEEWRGMYSEWGDSFVQVAGGRVRAPDTYYAVEATGELAYLEELIDELALPDSKLAHFVGPALDDADGVLRVTRRNREPRAVAAVFRHEYGKVLLVSEPALFTNLGLGESDNAVAAYHLAVGSGARPVVIDEFYHGAMAQGNQFVLLAYFPYSVIGALIFLAALVWAWAQGVRFGPPADPAPPTRRNILEYVDAMAQLFWRGRKSRFVLQTCREGVLAEIGRELLLPPGTATDVVLARLERVEPGRAARLGAALRAVDTVLLMEGPLSVANVEQLQGELARCRMSLTKSAAAMGPLPSFTGAP